MGVGVSLSLTLFGKFSPAAREAPQALRGEEQDPGASGHDWRRTASHRARSRVQKAETKYMFSAFADSGKDFVSSANEMLLEDVLLN